MFFLVSLPLSPIFITNLHPALILEAFYSKLHYGCERAKVYGFFNAKILTNFPSMSMGVFVLVTFA